MAVSSEFLNFRSLSSHFWTICLSLALSGVVFILYYILKYIYVRVKYGSLPGPKLYLFNILGTLSLLPVIKKSKNGYSLQTIALQVAEGFGRLYPNEPIVFGWLGGYPIALANKPEAIQAIMTDQSMIEKPFLYKFAEPVIGRGLVTCIGSKWKPRRRMLNPSYHIHVLMDFLPIFNEHGGKLVKILQKRIDEEIELLKPISLCVLDIVSETILGTKIGAQENKNKAYVDGLRSVFSVAMQRILTIWHWPGFVFRYSESGKMFYQNMSHVHDLTRSALEQKKKEYLCRGPDETNKKRKQSLSDGPNAYRKRKPLMDILVESLMENKNISEEDIIEEVDTFTAASNESTAASLLFTLYLLGLDKEIQADAHQELDRIFGDDKERHVEKKDLMEMSYIECIIKESLRLYPTVPLFGREVPAHKTLCGHKLPAGMTIAIIPYVLHRDPKLFPNPEKFDPSRFFPENSVNRSQYAYIPFSAGSRNCIGQKFAMLEMKVILAHVLRNFTVESLDPRDKVQQPYSFL